MGIYDRDYIRNDGRGDGLFADAPVTKYLILANVIVYLLQIFLVGDGQLNIVEWCALETAEVMNGQIWRLVTYGFCHDRYSIWHIVFNMALLYWFGHELEAIYGPREFLVFYLSGIVAAGAAHVVLDLATGSRAPAIGASGGVMAVMMLYTWLYPRHIIYIFWVIPIELRYAMALYLVWDLHPVLLALTGDRSMSGVAHAAHLGGLVFGFCYAKFGWRLTTFGERFVPAPRRKFGSRPKLRIAPDTVPEPDPENDRVDAILQKIMEHGRSSLTEEERQTLLRASERIRREQGDPLDD